MGNPTTVNVPGPIGISASPRPKLLTLPADRVEMLADLAHYAISAEPKDKDAALKMIRAELSQALGMQRGRG